MFDWITWSIWLVGFIILVVWIVVPYREFRRITKTHKADRQGDNP